MSSKPEITRLPHPQLHHRSQPCGREPDNRGLSFPMVRRGKRLGWRPRRRVYIILGLLERWPSRGPTPKPLFTFSMSPKVHVESRSHEYPPLEAITVVCG